MGDTLKLPPWVGARKVTNITAWPVFWQRAVFWRGRQWYVLRRWAHSRLYRAHIEWSHEWGFALHVELNRWRFEVGFTGPLVLTMRGEVSHSVLGVSRL